MFPKEFIKHVLINELEEITKSNAYISFALIGIGIEFLGKCMDSKATSWNIKGRSKHNFEFAINNLESFKPYRKYLGKFKIWDSLRNGFAHSFVPKYSLTLSSRNEMEHLKVHTTGNRLNLKIEELYSDFKEACIEVLETNFDNSDDKMNKDFLSAELPKIG